MTNTLIAQNIACTRRLSPVFEGISFTLRAGEMLLLTGANGSGKTSLLRILAGLLPAADGTLTYNDAPLTLENGQNSALFLSQDIPLKPVLSMRENLAFLCAALGLALSPQSLENHGLTRLLDYPVRYLSSGQKRRAMMALLMAGTQDIVLLDEPTTHLDAQGISLLQKLIRDLQSRGAMVIIATHNPEYFPNAKMITIGHATEAKARA